MDMNERLIKAQEALAKLEKTLERHTIRHEKLVEMKRTGKLSKRYRESPDPGFWLDGDIEWCEEDIQNTVKKIEARKQQIAELTDTIKKKEQEIAELPEILKKLQKELETRWNQYDRKNGETGTERQNKIAAQIYVLDLMRRVKAKVGTVTDYSGITLNGPALNGMVKGTKGNAIVETIVAGGWNIQRLHTRTLVK